MPAYFAAMKANVAVIFAFALLPLRAGEGVHPRGEAADYPAHASGEGFAIGARVLRSELVRQLFAADLTHAGYIVVEVGLYPEVGRTIAVVPQDFLLSQGAPENGSRASGARAVAEMVAQDPDAHRPAGKNVTLYPTSEVGYETGVDPVTGRRVNSTSVGGGMGVGIGTTQRPPPPPEAAALDRENMTRVLADLSFPEGAITEPTAGYLYFPRPSKKARGPFELIWYAPSGKVHLSVPQSEKK